MSKILDLTLPIHEGMPTYPSDWHPIVDIKVMGRIGMEARRSHSVTLGSHTGTHMDSPAHMVQDGITIDNIPLETIVGETKVIDFSNKGKGDYITLNEIENCGTEICKGDRLLIKTGWYKNWGTNDYYTDWPWIQPEAAKWLVDKGVILVCLDIPSPDDPNSDTGYGMQSPIHNIFLENGVILVEYLTNTLNITSDIVKLTALPLKVKDCDGFPARVIVEF